MQAERRCHRADSGLLHKMWHAAGVHANAWSERQSDHVSGDQRPLQGPRAPQDTGSCVPAQYWMLACS